MNPLKKNNQQEDEFQILNVFRDILRKWHYFLIAGVFFTGLALLYVRFTLPVYQASSSILIDDEQSSPANVSDLLSSDLFGTNLNLPTEIGILRSRTVIQETIKRLNLEVQYWSTTNFPTQPLYPKSPIKVEVDTFIREYKDLAFSITVIDSNYFNLEVEYDGDKLPAFYLNQKFAFGQDIETKHFKFRLQKGNFVKPVIGGTYEFKVRSANKLIAEMLENLTAEPLDKDANIVRLTYMDVIPVRALDILNEVGKVYIDLDIQDKAEVASLTLKFVDEQLNNTGSMLSTNEQEMQAFKEKNKTVDLSEESKAVLQKLNVLDLDRVKNNIEITSLQNLFNYLTTNDDITNLAPTSLGIPDPLLVELITNLQALQAKRKSVSFGVKNDAPAVRVLDQQISENRSALIENVKSIQKRLVVTRDALNTQLDKYEGSIKQVPEMERELLGIKRNFEVNQNIYTYLLQKKAETSIAKATAVSDNKILDTSALADEPVEPNKKIIVAVILLLTMIIPTTIITAKSLLRNTVLNRDDIGIHTEVPVIGVVGHSDETLNLVVSQRPKSAIAEAFRTIRTNLQYYGQGDGCKTILITSSVGGEGKSFITLNLAGIIAMQQQKVVVLGLDLRKPKLFNDFGWKNDMGASNYLVGAHTLDQVIRKTENPFLDIIISGPTPPNPAELLSKPLMGEMLAELKKRYDFIVIDTPPIGVVSDAFILLNQSDVNLYVVRQGYSRLEFLKTLDDLYTDGKIPNASIVLNDSDFSTGSGYGHHYGYLDGNAGYYDEREEAAAKKRAGWRRWLPF
ncbi:MAG: polysaccharide biosynthesis tyrosine autokinase [Bacteroidia bacterium]|jgi:tyrosine-protein kinase Etk/Wzc|nr:polysaccharide biosynthesis tyrosine autokinase [Bacteroidota bacterium]MBP6512883.1 polysaccharide biosynthesis tyrosine autokinase [Bacteroidia bacterium]MBP7245156.1 polysaccharide biosynthesis tyrosine autokinase [Bacteroidia bacterium]